MALIKCKECGNQISTEASSCPQCGAKNKKSGGCLSIIGYIAVFIFATSLLGKCALDGDKDKAAETEKARLATMTPAQIEAEKKAKEQEESEKRARNLMSKLALDSLKNSLNDPSSLEIEKITANKKGTVVCIDYRAKNAFGGLIRSYVTFVNGKPSKDAGVWNTNCAVKGLYDTSFVKLM